MSEALSKVAGLTPQALFAMSLLTGAGGFGGMRLLRDAMTQIHQPKPESNGVKLMIPDPSLAQPHPQQEAEKIGGDLAQPNAWWAPYAAVGLGVPAGFLGAKTIYDKYQQHQGQNDVDAAKKQYMQALLAAQQANHKIGEETPFLDNFCEALASELTKESFSLASPIYGAADAMFDKYPQLFGSNPPVEPGVTTSQLREASGAIPQNITDAQNTISGDASSLWGKIIDTVTLGTASNAAKAWTGAAAGVGLGGLGLAIRGYHKKKELEQKAQYPTTVEYAGQ